MQNRKNTFRRIEMEKDEKSPKIVSITVLTSEMANSIKESEVKDSPIVVRVSNDKKTVEIYNFYTERLPNVLLSVTDDKDNDIPVYEFDSLTPKSLTVLHIPGERYASISSAVTLKNIDYHLVWLPDEFEERKACKDFNAFYKLKEEAKKKAENEKKLHEAVKRMLKDDEAKRKKEQKTKQHKEKVRRVLASIVPPVILVCAILIIIFLR